MVIYIFMVIAIGATTAEFDHEIDHKYRTLPETEFAEYFNSLNLNSTIAPNYSTRRSAGLILPDRETSGIPTKTFEQRQQAPDNFDAREQWPYCQTINEIINQGPCNDCYAVAPIGTASDRICIHRNVVVRLSPQEGTCVQDNVCAPGYMQNTFQYWIDQGFVTTDCKPYDLNALLNGAPCLPQCSIPGYENYYESDKYFGSQLYWLSNNEEEIKSELAQNGPIIAGFALYSDLQDHHSGIYVHYYGDFLGYHCVRVIGYGEDNGVPYWLAANTWGEQWGENGFFKVQRYQDALGFEDSMMTALPR